MGFGDVLTMLLARHRLIACAAPEFCVVLAVSVLCAEVRRKWSATRRCAVTPLWRVVGGMAAVVFRGGVGAGKRCVPKGSQLLVVCEHPRDGVAGRRWGRTIRDR